MYIAMNRFRIHAGREADFEKVWAERDSNLDEVPGFREFHLLRGETEDEITRYVSHSLWDSETAFRDWTRSESFRRSHARAASPEGTVAGHPQFEGYEIVL
ncbi:MAG: antibiotic biosynthesis monooxygenase [Myxococcota bacterium]